MFGEDFEEQIQAYKDIANIAIREICDFVESEERLIPLFAKQYRKMYDALMAQGFEREEAIAIITSMKSSLGNVKFNK